MQKWQKIALFLAFLPIIASGAYVSFEHIYTEVLTHGQNTVTAFMAPLSVDGLITVGYIKNRIVKGSLGLWRRIWCPIAVYGGLAVSLAANMDSSTRSDPISTAIAGWPALALFVGIKTLGVELPSVQNAVHAVIEAITVEKAPVVKTPAKRATPAKKATPAKAAVPPVKETTPRKRTPAKKTPPSPFKAPVIDEVAQALS
jgi:hypothetical protein